MELSYTMVSYREYNFVIQGMKFIVYSDSMNVYILKVKGFLICKYDMIVVPSSSYGLRIGRSDYIYIYIYLLN